MRRVLSLIFALLPGFAAAQPAERGGEPSYAGAAACATCHPDTHAKWDASRHSKMVQPATAAVVKGDFRRATIKLRGDPYKLRATDGAYFITESYLTGKAEERRIDYTLGNRRIQHYLTTLPDGRIVVLPPTWDVTRKEWFHNLEIVDPAEKERKLVQVWNKNCYSCHVSQQEKNFTEATNSYKTEWLDFGTNCERCHGPAGGHVARYTRSDATGADAIVRQTRLDPVRNTMVCAQCHSLRDIVTPGYTAGEDYFDYYLPLLEYSQKVDHDPNYWPDGRTRRFSNDALGLWQSECFLKGGVACTDCHVDAHELEVEKNERLRPGQNALCTGCHDKLGQDVPAHTHHSPESKGSACVECHMPRTVFSIKTEIRDHAISIPVPENTLRFGIPNACNTCHADRKPEWALEAMNRWYGSRSREKLLRRATAFSLARAGDAKALDALIAIAENPAEGPLARANAVGYLDRFGRDPRVLPALTRFLTADHALIRTVAGLHLSQDVGDVKDVAPPLIRALSDPKRTVRMSAMLSLVNLGVRTLPGEAGTALERAKKDYLVRAEINADDGQAQLDLGKFHLLNGEAAEAEAALRFCLELEPELAAKYFLALAYVSERELPKAREVLKEIASSDPYFAPARALLEKIEAQSK